MPTGKVKWLDPKTGEACVVRRQHEYPTRVEELDTKARHAGVRVHFDIHRVEGVEHAVWVVPRRGTRTRLRHRRVGDLVGAHRADEAGHPPLTRRHPASDAVYRTPGQLVEAWLHTVIEQDWPTAVQLYASDAQLHLRDSVLVGRERIARFLEGGALQTLRDARWSEHGEDGTVRIEWSTRDGLQQEIHLRVAHGHIAEQWFLGGPR